MGDLKDILKQFTTNPKDAEKQLQQRINETRDEITRVTIKGILLSKHRGAVQSLANMRQENMPLLAWYVNPGDDGKKRVAIKDILSSRCPAVIEPLTISTEEVSLLEWYIDTAGDETETKADPIKAKRAAIKDILVSQCPSAIQFLVSMRMQPEDSPLLTWYIDQAGNDQARREAIKDILSSKHRGAIQSLANMRQENMPLLAWYVNPDDDGEKREAIKAILSTRCSSAIQFLVSMPPEDGLLAWYIDQAGDDKARRAAIKGVLSSQHRGAIEPLVDMRHKGMFLLEWYVKTTGDTGTDMAIKAKSQAIKAILSTRCSKAIHFLVSMRQEDAAIPSEDSPEAASKLDSPEKSLLRKSNFKTLATPGFAASTEVAEEDKGVPLLVWYINAAGDENSQKQAVVYILKSHYILKQDKAYIFERLNSDLKFLYNDLKPQKALPLTLPHSTQNSHRAGKKREAVEGSPRNVRQKTNHRSPNFVEPILTLFKTNPETAKAQLQKRFNEIKQTETEWRLLIKGILLAGNFGVIKLLVSMRQADGPILARYIDTAGDEFKNKTDRLKAKRAAIKDILVSHCPSAIQSLVSMRMQPEDSPLLTWYIDQAGNDQARRAAIKDILSSRCPAVIEPLTISTEEVSLLEWYIDTAGDKTETKDGRIQAKRAAIKNILSSRCFAAIQLLVSIDEGIKSLFVRHIDTADNEKKQIAAKIRKKPEGSEECGENASPRSVRSRNDSLPAPESLPDLYELFASDRNVGALPDLNELLNSLADSNPNANAKLSTHPDSLFGSSGQGKTDSGLSEVPVRSNPVNMMC